MMLWVHWNWGGEDNANSQTTLYMRRKLLRIGQCHVIARCDGTGPVITFTEGLNWFSNRLRKLPGFGHGPCSVASPRVFENLHCRAVIQFAGVCVCCACVRVDVLHGDVVFCGLPQVGPRKVTNGLGCRPMKGSQPNKSPANPDVGFAQNAHELGHGSWSFGEQNSQKQGDRCLFRNADSSHVITLEHVFKLG